MMPKEVRKWLRKQWENFYGASFEALLKRWDKCINVGGGYVEKYTFLPTSEYHMFCVLYSFVTYLVTLSRIFSNGVSSHA
jgi:hypothetical protein